jgi:hypothetical protein
VEGLLWVFGVIIYAKVTRHKNRAGLVGFWGVVFLLTVLWIGTLSGAPPANLHTAGISSLIFFLCVVAWAYWMNWARPLKEPERPDSIAQAHAG